MDRNSEMDRRSSVVVMVNPGEQNLIDKGYKEIENNKEKDHKEDGEAFFAN